MKEEIEAFFSEYEIKIYSDYKVQKLFLDLFRKVLGREVCTGCPGTLNAAVQELKSYSQSNQITMSKSEKFALKPESVCYDSIGHRHVTAANLTDESALNLLASNPAHLAVFDKFPSDWKKQVEEHLKKSNGHTKEAKEVKTGKGKGKEVKTEGAEPETKESYASRLGTLSEELLIVEANAKGLPEADWKELGKEEFIKYLVEKF